MTNGTQWTDLTKEYSQSSEMPAPEAPNGKKWSAKMIPTGTPRMVRWVMKLSGGLVKNEKQASYILLGFALLLFMTSLFLLFSGGEKEETFIPDAEAPAEEVIPPAEF